MISDFFKNLFGSEEKWHETWKEKTLPYLNQLIDSQEVSNFTLLFIKKSIISSYQVLPLLERSMKKFVKPKEKRKKIEELLFDPSVNQIESVYKCISLYFFLMFLNVGQNIALLERLRVNRKKFENEVMQVFQFDDEDKALFKEMRVSLNKDYTAARMKHARLLSEKLNIESDVFFT
jgi:hypothetical protein